MPKFFLPAATDDAQAETVLAAIRTNIGGEFEDQRLFALAYRHDGKEHYAEVGKQDDLQREIVIAILKKKNYPLFFVCTQNRGVARGGPILVGEHDITRQVGFDPD